MSKFPFVLMGLAILPFFLLPAFLAFKNRKRNAIGFAIGNGVLAIWIIGGFVAAGLPGLGALPSLIAWLLLLGFALRRDPPSQEDLNETVELKPYDPAWPESFAMERKRIANTLSISEEAIEHIGSTAVAGLESKPVIDMMVGTSTFPPTPDVPSRLAILGYLNLGEAGVPGRIHFRLREGAAFNVHVMQRGGELWANNLAIRELLRRDPDARARYTAARSKAIEEAGNRLLPYSAAKGPFLAELLAAAKNR